MIAGWRTALNSLRKNGNNLLFVICRTPQLFGNWIEDLTIPAYTCSIRVILKEGA